MSTVGGPGVYGKHPGEADFLHAGAGPFAQAGLDQWFEEATEALRRERLTLPDRPAGFLLAGTGAGPSFAGAFTPSRDAVGRTFPLIVFAPLSAGDDSPTQLYARSSAFIRDAAALLGEAATLTAADVEARAQALAAPAASTSVDVGGVFDGELVAPLVAALGDNPGALAYAVHTCASACEQATKAGGGSTAVITVDAPAPSAAARLFWLELLGKRLGRSRPSLLWTDGPDGRLLAALGPLPASYLCYLANPQHRATRFWPLRTDVAAAIDATLSALSPAQRKVIDDREATLAALLAAF
jgi:type VI secretion system ImpM family protein